MTKRKYFRNAASDTSTDTSDINIIEASDIDLSVISSSSQQYNSWWEKWWKTILQRDETSNLGAENNYVHDNSTNTYTNYILNRTLNVRQVRANTCPSLSTRNEMNRTRSSSFSSNSVPFKEPSSSYSIISRYIEGIISYYRLQYLEGDNDLYYTLRTQPFSSCIYLRGMLIAGFSNTLFHLYDYVLLAPPVTFPTFYHLTVYRLAVIFLLLHIFLNFLSIPTRIMLHYRCWRNSRVIDSESASIAIQELLSSRIWIFNRILAWTLDTISLTTLVCGQIYLWNDDSNAFSSPYLTKLIYNICATDILSFLIRSLVGAMYLLSFREFRDGSGKRNRGMSNFDLDRLETFQFSMIAEDKTTSPDCPICLQSYDANDLLLRLPCHERHCFHVDCVREWLKRQNACPLCQKIC